MPIENDVKLLLKNQKAFPRLAEVGKSGCMPDVLLANMSQSLIQSESLKI